MFQKCPYDPEDYTILGIQNGYDPKKEFENLGHGRLALDLMLYFVKQNPEKYVQIVLENSCNELKKYACPFVMISLAIAELLCETFCLKPEYPAELVKNRHSVYMKMSFETKDILEVNSLI